MNVIAFFRDGIPGWFLNNQDGLIQQLNNAAMQQLVFNEKESNHNS